jgi:hypothetical protein
MECSHSTGVKIKVVYSKRRAFPDCFAAYKYLPGLAKNKLRGFFFYPQSLFYLSGGYLQSAPLFTRFG